MSDFPGVGPVVKIPHFYYRGCGFDPWSKKKHMLCPVAKKKKKKKGGDYLGLLGWAEDRSKRQRKSLSERRRRSGEERFEP